LVQKRLARLKEENNQERKITTFLADEYFFLEERLFLWLLFLLAGRRLCWDWRGAASSLDGSQGTERGAA
jgi:hypothetical protein